MIEVMFENEKSALERLRAMLAVNEKVSAMELLEQLEALSEEEVEDVLLTLEDLSDKIDISDIPRFEQDEQTAKRLRLEEKLAKSGDLLSGLEENDPLRLFLEELAETPAVDEEQSLLTRYTAGEKELMQQLALRSLHRVVERACRLAGHGVLLLDLIQEGSLGLWQGIAAYTHGDYENHICGWIDRYLKKAMLVQAHANDVIYRAKQGMTDYADADQRLLAELGRNPTLEEIAEVLHVSVEEAATYASILAQARAKKQLEQAREPKEQTPDDEQAVENTAYFQTRQRIGEMLSSLTEQQVKVLTLRFGLEDGVALTAEQVGKLLELSPEEVIQIETEALLKLRKQET